MEFFLHRLHYSRPYRTLDTSTIHWGRCEHGNRPGVHTKIGVRPPRQGRLGVATTWRWCDSFVVWTRSDFDQTQEQWALHMVGINQPPQPAVLCVMKVRMSWHMLHMCSRLLGSRLRAAGLLCILQEATRCLEALWKAQYAWLCLPDISPKWWLQWWKDANSTGPFWIIWHSQNKTCSPLSAHNERATFFTWLFARV